MAASKPFNVSGYIRSLIAVRVNVADGVICQCASGVGFNQTARGNASNMRLNQTSPGSSFQCSTEACRRKVEIQVLLLMGRSCQLRRLLSVLIRLGRPIYGIRWRSRRFHRFYPASYVPSSGSSTTRPQTEPETSPTSATTGNWMGLFLPCPKPAQQCPAWGG